MDAIGFAPELGALIVDGRKTLTYRLDSDLFPGDYVIARDTATGLLIAHLLIRQRMHARFGVLPLDAPGHQPYANRAEMSAAFSRYYERVIAADEPMTILSFRAEPNVRGDASD